MVYRDRFNLDAFKRWMTYRNMQTSATGEAAPFTHAGGGKLSVAYLEGGIVTASTAGAHYYGLNGERLAEEVLSMDPDHVVQKTVGAHPAGDQLAGPPHVEVVHRAHGGLCLRPHRAHRPEIVGAWR